MIISGSARLAGVMGWPVAHSLSPRVHGYWLDHYGVDGAYVPLAVEPDAFGAAVASLAGMGFRGVNLTLPHKEAGLALCDEVEALARRIGAVNTLVFDEGRIIGSNSDAFGFLENLRVGVDGREPGWDPGAGPALVRKSVV